MLLTLLEFTSRISVSVPHWLILKYTNRINKTTLCCSLGLTVLTIWTAMSMGLYSAVDLVMCRKVCIVLSTWLHCDCTNYLKDLSMGLSSTVNSVALYWLSELMCWWDCTVLLIWLDYTMKLNRTIDCTNNLNHALHYKQKGWGYTMQLNNWLY